MKFFFIFSTFFFTRGSSLCEKIVAVANENGKTNVTGKKPVQFCV